MHIGQSRINSIPYEKHLRGNDNLNYDMICLDHEEFDWKSSGYKRGGKFKWVSLIRTVFSSKRADDLNDELN